MDQLRQIFETLEFSNVETFIASGNVIFERKPATANLLKKYRNNAKGNPRLRSCDLHPNTGGIRRNRKIQTLPAIKTEFGSGAQTLAF